MTTSSDRPDVRDALARGDWSIVLRAFLDGGLSQTVIAARTGLSQSQVSRLAGGKSRTPSINTVKALCDGLGVPRQFAGLLDDASQEDDTNRRQFLSGSLSVLAAGAIPHSDLRDGQLLMATSLSYRQLEQRTPARSLAQPVTAHLSLACDMPGGPRETSTPACRRRWPRSPVWPPGCMPILSSRGRRGSSTRCP
jgi:transcriptional regulator with XRE-family HTH domain